MHELSKWLEMEDQVVQHVSFLQEGLCAGDADCLGAVADWYPDMNKHTTQNFIVPHATPVLCADLCDATAAPTDAPTAAPTDAPTDAPTEAPTDAPTDDPTDGPTSAVTGL